MLNQKRLSVKTPETEMKTLDLNSSRIYETITPVTTEAQAALQNSDLNELKRLINTVNKEIDDLKAIESLEGFNEFIINLKTPLTQETMNSISNLEWWKSWRLITNWMLNKISYYSNNKDIITRTLKIYQELHSTLLEIKSQTKEQEKYTRVLWKYRM